MVDKNLLRKELLRKRDEIPCEVRKVKGREIIERLISLDEIVNARVLFLFASFRSEVDTFGIAECLLGNGKRIVFPKVDRERHALILYEVKEIVELGPGFMGIPEPSVLTDDRTVDINNVDAVIIPGAAFDTAGNRIGYGGGYYDMLLSTLRKGVPVIAPCYEEQIVEAIPSEPHDIRVDIIVTDRRLIRCTRAPGTSG
jgi:5-formyltetrahydrofolate cyclo-ligase